MGVEPVSLMPVVVEALTDGDEVVRMDAVATLARMDPNSNETTRTLREIVHTDASEKVQRMAVHELEERNNAYEPLGLDEAIKALGTAGARMHRIHDRRSISIGSIKQLPRSNRAETMPRCEWLSGCSVVITLIPMKSASCSTASAPITQWRNRCSFSLSMTILPGRLR